MIFVASHLIDSLMRPFCVCTNFKGDKQELLMHIGRSTACPPEKVKTLRPHKDENKSEKWTKAN